MTISQISSAVLNHLKTGLRGLTANIDISVDQIADEVVAERNIIIREYLLKGILSLEELFLAINCIEVNCENMSKCCDLPVGQTALHFEIPPILYLSGLNTIRFVGSTDRKVRYNIYTDEAYRFHQYKKHNPKEPYVYIDTAINSNGNMDGYIFNVPMTKYISVIALFLDPRRLLEGDCCAEDPEVYMECGILSDEIVRRLTEKYVRGYKQFQSPVLPNDQVPK